VGQQIFGWLEKLSPTRADLSKLLVTLHLSLSPTWLNSQQVTRLSTKLTHPLLKIGGRSNLDLVIHPNVVNGWSPALALSISGSLKVIELLGPVTWRFWIENCITLAVVNRSNQEMGIAQR